MISIVIVAIVTVVAVSLGEAIGPGIAEWAPGAWAAWRRQHAHHQMAMPRPRPRDVTLSGLEDRGGAPPVSGSKDAQLDRWLAEDR